MKREERFAELWTAFLEGTLQSAEEGELRELLAAHEQLRRRAVDEYQLHRLLSFAARQNEVNSEVFVSATLTRIPKQPDSFVASVIGRLEKSLSRTPRSRRNSRFLGMGYTIALVLVVVLSVSAWFWYPHRQPSGPVFARVGLRDIVSGEVLVNGSPAATCGDSSTICVVGDQPAVLRLIDGSEAKLLPGTSAIYHGPPTGPWESLELTEGEGRFYVARKSGEFQVETGVGLITSLDSDFSVDVKPVSSGAFPDVPVVALTVAVETGVVQVDLSDESHVLKSGERQVFSRELDRSKVPDTGGLSDRDFARGPRGVVVSVDEEAIVLSGHGFSARYELAQGASVTIDGHPGKIDELRPGMNVALGRVADRAPVIAIRAEGPMIGGEIKALDTKKRTVTVARVDRRVVIEQTFPFSPDVDIRVGGRPAQLSDLHLGTTVTLRLAVDRETVVAINRAMERTAPKKPRRTRSPSHDESRH